MTTIGLLHPGEMGAGLGGALADRGHTVLWLPEGRSRATAERAAGAGLTSTGSLSDLLGRAEVVLSVCPPQAAPAVAASVASDGFGGLVVDANAIAPRTVRTVAATVTAAGATFVDGGIIGLAPQPGSAGGPRLYLSGEPGSPAAAQVAALFDGTAVTACLVDGGVGAASAVKMAYAAWTKGSAALLLAARALARTERVEGTLLAEWGASQPQLAARTENAARSAAAKGWRWDPEMTEIAAAMADAGLPDGFHQAAAEVFRCAPRADPAGLAETAPGDVVELVLEALAGEHLD
ncbi:MAG: NAD(P)-dependent oxidoreductase [Actinobacteria bacterium]|nr:NAD(P)-dependent oxidoreductase [Actinomycetota bacterium]